LRSLAAEHPGGAIAAVVLGAIALAAAFAPLIAPQNPFDLSSFDVLDAGLPPSWLDASDPRFLLGTDAQGRDLWSAILYGTRISLTVGLLAVLIAAAIGIPLGLFAGYAGGRIDTVVTRAADIQLSLSTLMTAIIALALFRAGFGGEGLNRFAVPLLAVVIGLAEWPYLARTARAATQVEAAKDYVRAARALGASTRGLLWRHILPNIVSPLIVVATTQIAGAIMAEAALSFLGLGVQPPTPSWGSMIADARDLLQLRTAPWTSVFPGLAIGAAVLGFNLLGDALRDALDPRFLAGRDRAPAHAQPV
jgi:peptide/nickel transport system permease protein